MSNNMATLGPSAPNPEYNNVSKEHYIITLEPLRTKLCPDFSELKCFSSLVLIVEHFYTQN